MNIKLKQLGSNMTELAINGKGTVLFSYQTPVAAHTPTGTIRTNEYYSVTTSKHINKWLNGVEAKTVSQETIDNLLV